MRARELPGSSRLSSHSCWEVDVASAAPSLGSEPPPVPHCSSGGECQPSLRISPPRARSTAVCMPAWSGGSHRPFCIYFKVLDFVAFFFQSPCKVGHLLLFQLPLSFFGTRQILSFDSEGIRLSGPEDCCGGRGWVLSHSVEDIGPLEAWVREKGEEGRQRECEERR